MTASGEHGWRHDECAYCCRDDCAEPEICGAELDEPELLTPQEWAAREGWQILDPDGWRGKNAPPFDQPCTREEWEPRMWQCTVKRIRPKGRK